jgi:hypothetical protein
MQVCQYGLQALQAHVSLTLGALVKLCSEGFYRINEDVRMVWWISMSWNIFSFSVFVDILYGGAVGELSMTEFDCQCGLGPWHGTAT